MVDKDNKWEPATVVGINSDRPRSYNIRMVKNFNIISRNRKFLRKCKNDNFTKKGEDIYEKILENKLRQDRVEDNNSSRNQMYTEEKTNANSNPLNHKNELNRNVADEEIVSNSNSLRTRQVGKSNDLFI